MLRNTLRTIEVHTNQDLQPIIFNYAERPVEIKKVDPDRIKVLASIIINLINKFGEPILGVKYIKVLNELHEETDQQSRIVFDLKLELNYTDSENLGKKLTPEIIYIQPEFVFEKTYNILPEDSFFKPDNKVKFKTFLSKLIIIGSEHLGFLGGRYGIRKTYSKRN